MSFKQIFSLSGVEHSPRMRDDFRHLRLSDVKSHNTHCSRPATSPLVSRKRKRSSFSREKSTDIIKAAVADFCDDVGWRRRSSESSISSIAPNDEDNGEDFDFDCCAVAAKRHATEAVWAGRVHAVGGVGAKSPRAVSPILCVDGAADSCSGGDEGADVSKEKEKENVVEKKAASTSKTASPQGGVGEYL